MTYVIRPSRVDARAFQQIGRKGRLPRALHARLFGSEEPFRRNDEVLSVVLEIGVATAVVLGRMYARDMAEDVRTMKERMLAGDLYIPENDPDLASDFIRSRSLLHRLNSMDPNDAAGRRAILSELLSELGKDSEILPPFRCDFGYQISVGERTFANYGLLVLDVAKVTIGDAVQIGPNVQLLTPTHPLDPQQRRDRWEAALPITIEDNAWLGGGVIVCPGVSIGENTVVGAGAVVTRSLPANVLAVGNPARILKGLPS